MFIKEVKKSAKWGKNSIDGVREHAYTKRPMQIQIHDVLDHPTSPFNVPKNEGDLASAILKLAAHQAGDELSDFLNGRASLMRLRPSSSMMRSIEQHILLIDHLVACGLKVEETTPEGMSAKSEAEKLAEKIIAIGLIKKAPAL